MTHEISVYTQNDKYYCQDCQPRGTSQCETLVTSSYDHCCAGCGNSLRELAEGRRVSNASTRIETLREATVQLHAINEIVRLLTEITPDVLTPHEKREIMMLLYERTGASSAVRALKV